MKPINMEGTDSRAHRLQERLLSLVGELGFENQLPEALKAVTQRIQAKDPSLQDKKYEELLLAAHLQKLGFDYNNGIPTMRFLNEEIALMNFMQPFQHQPKDKLVFTVITIHPLSNHPAFVDTITGKVWKEGKREKLDISRRYDRRDGPLPHRSQIVKDITTLYQAREILEREKINSLARGQRP